jgi:hypothetical protein
LIQQSESSKLAHLILPPFDSFGVARILIFNATLSFSCLFWFLGIFLCRKVSAVGEAINQEIGHAAKSRLAFGDSTKLDPAMGARVL